MTIQLFNSTAELNVLNKSGSLTLVTTLTGTLREGCNLLDPSIVIQYETLPSFNYVYIPELNRYYFVKDIDNLKRNLWVIKLHVDVLMTYRTQILQLEAEVDRNEFDYDLLLQDNNRVNEVVYDVDITESDTETIFSMPDNSTPREYYDAFPISHNIILYSLEGSTTST